MPSLTTYIVQTVVTLLAIVVLAVLVLYAARRLGVGRAAGPLELVGRLPLDARRTVYLVRVAEKVFVLGASEAGLSKLGEIPGDSFPPEPPTRTSSTFAEVLARALGRQQPEEPDAPKR
jgi:flagellar protein FliO/FliZ